jgi:hypothetical protein
MVVMGSDHPGTLSEAKWMIFFCQGLHGKKIWSWEAATLNNARIRHFFLARDFSNKR